MEEFTTEVINNEITRIHSAYGVDMFLIQGEQKAMLIDTGYGVGKLKAFVDSLTDLPYEVLITHGHVDHAGGTAEFENVYMNYKDCELEREHTTVKFRREFAKMLSGKEPNETDMVEQRKRGYLNLEDGQTFDLGGITLEAIGCAGHTPGCMCVLVKELKILILGDACNSKSFFFFPEALKISDYLKNLSRLQKREKEFDHVLFFHPDNIGDKNNIEENLEVCREILVNKDKRIPKKLLGYDLFVAETVGENDLRTDGKTANIFYAKDKI